MTDKEILEKSDLTVNFKVLKSKYRTFIFLPITGLNKKLMAISVYKDELKRTEYKLTESENGKLTFVNLLTYQENVFDLSELSLGKIHFQFQNGLCETFEVTSLEPLNDLQQYLV
ncbi:hypothetical protein [Tamlana crocina]|uniref:Uncharacterized protein n=1 Tax=Tamlana crocina TaxID=393006 RepID=A0ABX1DGV8_9FLAO|nr:hypothetical protein [Tamlana crocina]NJX16747.1 hypothetical protein [Tamlana crocina]